MTTLKTIASEWDRNAQSRCRQLEEGRDVSHDRILVPSILHLAGRLRGSSVLDVGCGCGFLTSSAARRAKNILGIDISERMIEEAKHRHKRSNLSFRFISVELLAREEKKQYDICLSNMSVITMPNLSSSIHAIATLLKAGGKFVFSIAHPCFWNFYRSDESRARFNYWNSHSVSAPFRITFDQKPLPVSTTYFHRSLTTYFNCLAKAGLQLEELLEPKPSKNVPRDYVSAFSLPRFMVLCARKL